MELNKRPMIEVEDKYTFRQNKHICQQAGLIGYLRADMDTDGNGFFSSWNGWNYRLKTPEFKEEFDEVINSLRKEGDILHNRKALANYCYSTPQSKMQTEQDYYGVRVDTEKYAYLLRLNPNKSEYNNNMYCFCYRKDRLDGHMRNAREGIRFIDSHYKELFRIPDGGKIKIHYSPQDEGEVCTCRYLDTHYVVVGDIVYHIWDFMEFLEDHGYTCEPVSTISKSPNSFFSNKEREYQKFKLQWMLDHDISLQDLMKEFSSFITEICEDARETGEDLEELLNSSSFEDHLEERGFGGMLWPCYEEWLDCEGRMFRRDTSGSAATQVTNNDLPELVGQLIDIFEDFLSDKNIEIKNPEKEDAIADGEDPEEIAILYGTDYGEIQSRVEDTLIRWKLAEPWENAAEEKE